MASRIARMGLPSGVLNSLGTDEERTQKARTKALTNPAAVDSTIASYLKEQLPEGTRVRKGTTKTGAVSKAFSSSDPRKTLGEDIKRDFNKLLTDPKFSDVSPERALRTSMAFNTEARREATNKYVRQEESSLLFGDKVKRPEGYEKWLSQTQSQEDAAATPVKGLVEGAPVRAAEGGALAAAGVALKSTRAGRAVAQKGAKIAVKAAAKVGVKFGLKTLARVAATGLVATPEPLTTIIGGAALGVLEFWAFEKASEAVERSEWGRANEGTVKAAAASLAAGGLVAGGAHALQKKAFGAGVKRLAETQALSEQAMGQLAKFPTARKTLDAMKAKGNADAAQGTMAKLAEQTYKAEALATEEAETAQLKGLYKEDLLNVLKGIEARPLEGEVIQGTGRKITLSGDIVDAQGLPIASPVGGKIAKPRRTKAPKGFGEGAVEAVITEDSAIQQRLRNLERVEGKIVAEEEAERVALREFDKTPEGRVKINETVSPSKLANKELTTQLSHHQNLAKAAEESGEKKVLKVQNKRVKELEAESAKRITAAIQKVTAENAEHVVAKAEKGTPTLEAIEQVVEAQTVIAKQEATPAVNITKKAAEAKPVMAETAKVRNAVEEAAFKEKAVPLAERQVQEEAGRSFVEEFPLLPTGEARKRMPFVRGNEIVSPAYGKGKNAVQELVMSKHASPAEAERELLSFYGRRDAGENKARLGDFIKNRARTEEYGELAGAVERGVADLGDEVPIVRFSNQNPPPIVTLKKSAQTEADFMAYQAVMKQPGYRAAQDEALVKINDENWSAFASKANRRAVKSVDEIPEERLAEIVEDSMPPLLKAASRVMDEAPEVVETATKGKSPLKTMIALAAPSTLGILGLDSVTAEDAEAGVFARLPGIIAKTTEQALIAEGKKITPETLLQAAKKAGYMPGKAKSPFMPHDMVEAVKVKPSRAIIKNTEELALNGGRLLSPHNVDRHFYKAGQSPMIELASRTTAAHMDTAAGLESISNIMAQVPNASGKAAKIAAKEITRVMKPVDDLLNPIISQRGYRQSNINSYQKILAKATKKAGKGDKEAQALLKDFEPKLAAEQKAYTALESELNAAHMQWDEAVKPLAAKFPTTRIALAAEDSAKFEKYPWLKNMLSFEEKTAVARLKDFNQEYAFRLEVMGNKAITEEAFMHHAMHPNRDFKKVNKMFENLAPGDKQAAALSRFHHRASGSRQMMPDVNYVMDRYIPDANRRIQYGDFWKKGKKDGWDSHMNSLEVQSSEAMSSYWRQLKKGFAPQHNTTADTWARKYASFEVFRLLALSPSVAFKHAIKVSATMAGHDIDVAVKTVPKALRYALKNAVKEHAPKKFGRALQFTEEEQAIKAFTRQGTYLESIADFGLGDQPITKFDNFLGKMNHSASVMIDTVEQFDRGVSYLSSLEMAAKRGMTTEQALYGVYDTILKNNFLGGIQNAPWLRNPKIRAFFMFQGTPFKIAERRLMQVMQTGKALNATQKEVWSQLQNVKKNMREGERLFKGELIASALKSETDHFGTPVTKQVMKEITMLGGLVVGAKEALGVDLTGHATHLPFIKFNESDPAFSMNPVTQAAYKTWQDKENEDDEFYMSRFLRSWLKEGGLPNTLVKTMRLSNDDIPERYLDSRFPEFSYMFGMPAVGAGH